MGRVGRNRKYEELSAGVYFVLQRLLRSNGIVHFLEEAAHDIKKYILIFILNTLIFKYVKM
jgi:hypothetical protein